MFQSVSKIHLIHHNPYIEEEQTTQWPKKENYKRTNKDAQNITQKTKDRVTRTTLKLGLNLGSSKG